MPAEDIALPEAVMNHVKKESNHQNIYVMDWELAINQNDANFYTGIHYIHLQEQKRNRKYVELTSLMKKNQGLGLENPCLLKTVKFNSTPVPQLKTNREINITKRY